MSSRLLNAEEFRNGIPFIAGRLWLDLLNTLPCDGTGPRDLLETAEGYAAWVAAAGILPGSAGLDQSGGALRAFRDALRPAFDELRCDGRISPFVLDAVNAKLSGMCIRLALAQDAAGARLVAALDPGMSGIAGIVAEDFARFAADYERERLKRCANDTCPLVFYDTGKNNTRRWCAMAHCGNRHKVARYRARQAERRNGA